MIKKSTGWPFKIAKKYNWYCSFPQNIYTVQSDFFVDQSSIKPNSLVIDLCCGTGVTTLAINKKLKNSGKIFAIDNSPYMLQYMKENLKKNKIKNTTIILGDANNLDKILPKKQVGKVNVCLCSNAIWHLNFNHVLKKVSKVLKKNGVFAFSFASHVFRMRGRFIQEILDDEISNLAKEKYGIKKVMPMGKKKYNYKAISRTLKQTSFEIIKYKILDLKPSAQDQKRFYKDLILPRHIFNKSLLPELKTKKAIELCNIAIERAIKKATKHGKVKHKVAFFITQKV